jgi:hypothetical protein
VTGLAARPGGRPQAVPAFTTQPIDELGVQLVPRQHRHAYAAAVQRGLPTGETPRLRS